MASPRMFPALLTALAALPLAAQGAPKALSLQEAIATALENNLQVKIARATQEQGGFGVQSALGAYDWRLGSTLSMTRGTSDARTREGYDNTLGHILSTSDGSSRGRDLSIKLDKAFDWGANYTFTYHPSYASTTSATTITRLDPLGPDLTKNQSTTYPYAGSWSMNFSQSLLKNFGRDVAGADLLISRKNAENADFLFQSKIIQLVSDIETQYWMVVGAERFLANKKLALELARKQLRENRIRVEVGTMAPIEITSAEAAEAIQLQAIISAEADLANAKDLLLRSLYPDQERPSDLNLTDAPTVSRLQINEEQAQKMALERRMELKMARINLDTARITEKVAVQNRLPQLDVNVGLSSDANAAKAYSSINSDLGRRSNPGYSLGLTLAVPIQNRAALANLSSKRAQRRSSELTLRDQELSIMLEVRSALRSVEAAEKGMKAAEKSRIFSEKDLDAEQKKFDNGMSTNFFVLQKQSALDATRTSELKAQIDYAKAVTTFEKAVGNLLEARKLAVK